MVARFLIAFIEYHLTNYIKNKNMFMYTVKFLEKILTLCYSLVKANVRLFTVLTYCDINPYNAIRHVTLTINKKNYNSVCYVLVPKNFND